MNLPWDLIIEKLFEYLDRCIPASNYPSYDMANLARVDYIKQNKKRPLFRATVRRAVTSAGVPFGQRIEAVKIVLEEINTLQDSELSAMVGP